jgi:glucose-6-phosphate 1-epimerase
MQPSLERFGELVSVRGPDGAEASFSLHGGQLLSWRGRAGDERLFVSSLAAVQGPKGQALAIRGGVPVCFPQFAGLGPLPKHGFARLERWTPLPGRGVRLDVEAGRWPGWPGAVGLEVLARPFEAHLEIEISIEVRGAEAVEFTLALHTYLAVDDVTDLELLGAEGRRAREAERGEFVQAGPLRFEGEVDRQLLGLERPLELWRRSGAGYRPLLRVEQSGLPDAVVWNIGATKAASLSDLGPGEWRRYVCIEAAWIEAPKRLEPGQRLVGVQRLERL